MRYLFDTDIISALVRKKASERLRQQLVRAEHHAQLTSSITLGELVFGAHRVGRLDLLAKVRLALAALEVKPFDAAAAEVYGPLRARLEKRGTPMAEADLRIASIALANDCVLVTGNVKHFVRVEELQIENWL